MDQEQLKLEHKERVTHACTLAIHHAALLCSESTREFVTGMTTAESLAKPASSLGKIGYKRRGLSHSHLAEINLLRALGIIQAANVDGMDARAGVH
jgi:hypothetical protein